MRLNRQVKVTKLIPEEIFTYFHVCLPNILNNVIAKRDYIQSSGIADHIQKITQYNVTGGKHLRSSLTLHSFLTLAAANAKEEALYKACVLAWATDMVHACFTISDDIEDEASMRRGKPCWHLVPKVGMRAINDISLIRGLIYDVLNVTFEDQAIVNDVRKMFDKAFFLTAIGQHLDNEASQITDRIYLANKTTANTQQYVESMCMDIARLYQMQDDYFDCFGSKDVGKSCTDIQNSKCSWLAVKALQRCSQPQKIVFKSCYGSEEFAHIERIQQLYKILQLPEMYKDEEKALYDDISHRANASKDILPPALFLDYLNVIYNRML
ncbi:farnesyl pyrophosphate synthase [Amyelois transitella]|uniref:farnesyl pyrophosphate synthase n=1 Tax=Amyelois transitella TaxID=680683 RepID=UPI00298F9F40|nr:farnesyl pyrophosphate synthase [Amyelois transitella]